MANPPGGAALARLVRRSRPPIAPPASARTFVDAALAELKASRWSLRAWGVFTWRTVAQSCRDAAVQRRAFVELSVAHLALAALRPGGWPAASWLMTVSHLGLLGDRSRPLGWANRITMVRANLPAVAPEAPAWAAVAALATDCIDGSLARRTGDTTAFGAYADALADAAFWPWFAVNHEPDRAAATLAVAACVAPPAALTLAYVIRGRSVDYPRPVLVRNLMVAGQLVIAARAVVRAARGSHISAPAYAAAGRAGHPPTGRAGGRSFLPGMADTWLPGRQRERRDA